MRVGTCLIGMFLAAAVPAFATAQDPQPPSASEPVSQQTVLERTATYIDLFVSRFSSVVSEERYAQEATAGFTSMNQLGRGSISLAPRTQKTNLKSDFLLVRLPDYAEWLPFRDVYEVNGTEIRDREGRLAKLFTSGNKSAIDRAREITAESARYNIGDVTRTINNPVIALAFLSRDYQKRFDFAQGKPDPAYGPNAWVLDYKERERPTLIRGYGDSDLVARGRTWVDVQTGHVLRTEFQLEDALVVAKITTSFKMDDRLGIHVPDVMTEDYRLGGGSHVTGKATYGRFRQFAVRTDELIQKPTEPEK